MENNTPAELTFQVLNWSQYFNILIRERAYNIVQESTVIQDYVADIGPVDGGPESDRKYTRNFVIVQDLKCPETQLRSVLFEQLINHGIDFNPKYDTLSEAAEVEALNAMENFTDITNCVLVTLGTPIQADGLTDGYTQCMLAPTSRDSLVIRMISPSQGCIIVYRPKDFRMFQVKTLDATLDVPTVPV